MGAQLHYITAFLVDRYQLDLDFSASLLCTLCALRFRQGDVLAAFEDVTLALAMAPRSTMARFCRGLLHMELNKCQEAMADFDKVARTVPNYVGISQWQALARR